MKTIIKDVIEAYELIEKNLSKVRKPKMVEDNLDRGFQVSKAACKQQELVAMSPIMKNMLVRFDGYANEKKLMVNDPPTKAEKWVNTQAKARLQDVNGEPIHEYDRTLPLRSKRHYDCDCYQNLKENMRDIQPGQEDERKKNLSIFARPTKSVFNVKAALQKDVVFQKTIELVMDVLPSVRASDEFHEINLPFMSKHTNVSYPYWYNDRTKVGKTDETYAALTMREAKALPLPRVLDYNISTSYGRNQRGKGRLLIAISRIVNLILNQLEGEEIKAYKQKSPLFAGYNDDTYLKNVLVTMLRDCEKYDLKAANWDQRLYDLHVSLDWIILLGAISIVKTNGSRGKQIALYRALLATRTWIVDGMSGKIIEIYGRIFSGFIDTNRGGGIINAIITLYCCMKQDKNYSKWVYVLLWFMLVMGDDNLFVYKVLDEEQFVRDMKGLGFEVHPDKKEFGIFFLQNRIFEDPASNELVMTYPWTRVLRSILFKEVSKGLGPYGWVLAIWQQLYKLIEYEPALDAVVSIIYPFDEKHLGLDITLRQLKAAVKEEDEKAIADNPNNETTATKLFDGDPTKAKQFLVGDNGTVEFSGEYLRKVRRAIVSSVNRCKSRKWIA